MTPPFSHSPVLLNETLDLLNLKTGTKVVDCTLGLGGHAEAILKRIGPKGRLMAFEQDEANLKVAEKRLAPYKKQILLLHQNFEHLAEEVRRHDFKPEAILMDLGLSSPHVDDASRGFSFRVQGPLDMRFDKRQVLTAETIVNSYPEKKLADLIFQYGEERKSRWIARAIVEARRKQRIETTEQLAELIAKKIRSRPGFHAATLTFQALRIAVNRELDVLETVLHQAVSVLEPTGRVAVISYHSLEDRLVKQTFRYYTQECICPKELPICQCNFRKKLYILTKKPIIPSGIEVSENPRSRSAKLRVAERL